jgi:hypothetical protein
VLLEIGHQGECPVATLPFAHIPSYTEMDSIDVEFDPIWVALECDVAACPMTLEAFGEIEVNMVDVELKLVWLTDQDFAASGVWAGILCAPSCRPLTVAKRPKFVVHFDLILYLTCDIQSWRAAVGNMMLVMMADDKACGAELGGTFVASKVVSRCAAIQPTFDRDQWDIEGQARW